MSSRVAGNPVSIPNGVEVTIKLPVITVKGKFGTLNHNIHPYVHADCVDNSVVITQKIKHANANALSGTTRALVQNMVTGVSSGFERALKMIGVGYRAKAAGNKLTISAGFSHPVDMVMPAGVAVETPNPTDIVLKGCDKQLLGQVAANIRAVRPPEPYKGKGIRYVDERVVLKEAKKK